MTARTLGPLFLILLLACTGTNPTRSASKATADATPSPPSGALAPSATPALARCPEDPLRGLRRNDVPGVLHTMVPGTPTVLVLCGETRVVVQGARVEHLVEALNALKLLPPGNVYDCPLNLGPVYGLHFDYANEDVLLVTVESSGCRFASNGRRVAHVDQAILARIQALPRAR